MTKYKIPVEWSVSAEITIEADSLEKAVEIAMRDIDDIVLPTDTTYIDSSFRIVNEPDLLEAMNSGGN